MASVAIKLDDELPKAFYQVIGGGAVALFLGELGRRIFRAMSRTKLDIAGDTADGNQIRRLDDVTAHQFERLESEIRRQSDRADREAERADIAYRERNEAIEKGAQAIAEVGMLRRQVEELERKIDALEHLLNGIYGGRNE